MELHPLKTQSEYYIIFTMTILELLFPGGRYINGRDEKEVDRQILGYLKAERHKAKKISPGVHEIELPDYPDSGFMYSVKAQDNGRGSLQITSRHPSGEAMVGTSFDTAKRVGSPQEFPIDKYHAILPIMEGKMIDNRPVPNEGTLHAAIIYIADSRGIRQQGKPTKKRR